jgi:hypothetical protein
MAARLNLRHQQMVRDKIQASQLLNRLENHALGECELSATQIKAIEILLRKVLPDLSAIQVDGDGEGGPVRHHIDVQFHDSAVPKQA